jgi:TrmH family RNA methyltransferase
MGAHFHLPAQSLDWPAIRTVVKGKAPELRCYLADSSAGISYTQADFRAPLALIVGGEAEGAGPQAIALADERVHIPMAGGSESLNAAVAAGLLMFEVARQREN